VALVAAAGLAVRVAYVLWVGRRIPTMGDAETYHLLADNLSAGRGYIRPHDFALTGVRVPTAEFPPVFPGLLAAADLAGFDSVTGQKLVMTLVGTVTIVLVGLLGRRVAGPVAGLVAAGVAAVHPPFFQPDGALMGETVYGAVVVLAMVLAYAALDRPSPARWLALGAAVGVAALTRVEALGLLVVLVVPLAVVVGRRERALRRGVVLGGVALVACVAVLLPWTVRNAARFDRLVPVSNNSGTLLLGANCPAVYDGDQTGLWRLDCVLAVDAAGLDEGDAFARYRSAGLRFAREHAGRVPAVAAVRVLRTWGLWDPTGQVAWESLEGRHRGWATVGHRMHLAVLALAVGGAVVLHRRRATWWPLASVAVLVTVMAAVGYGNQRFRMAAEPALAVAAAVAVVALVSRLTPERGRV
jgi:4-amino-4-deoxy-L-arabinose transferase-like glycosyltransferase